MSSPFLLVHGAFRGGWAWRRLRPTLVEAGHDVYAPSLRGCGERRHELTRVTSLDVWVDELEALVVSEDLRDLVLVGHSQGGIVTSALAARLPDRLRCVVHLDAAVPDPGERALDLGPAGLPEPPRETVVAPRPLVPGEGAATDLDAETAHWVNERLSPTPVGPSLDPVPAVPSGVPQVYVFCSGTPTGYPSTVTRARLDERAVAYRVLEAGHDAAITSPQLVADLLLDLVREPPAGEDPETPVGG